MSLQVIWVFGRLLCRGFSESVIVCYLTFISACYSLNLIKMLTLLDMSIRTQCANLLVFMLVYIFLARIRSDVSDRRWNRCLWFVPPCFCFFNKLPHSHSETTISWQALFIPCFTILQKTSRCPADDSPSTTSRGIFLFIGM